LRWNDLELLMSAVFGWLVRTPAPEMGEMSEASALHMLIRDLDHKLNA
jgi:hypothetical protein